MDRATRHGVARVRGTKFMAPAGRSYPGLMPANLITLPHLSVSSDMNFPKSADVIDIGSAPKADKPRLDNGISKRPR